MTDTTGSDNPLGIDWSADAGKQDDSPTGEVFKSILTDSGESNSSYIPPSQRTSIPRQIAGAANAFLLGGAIDTLGALPAGVGGLTALVTGAGTEEAAQVVEAISGKWRSSITEPLLNWVGPDRETKQASEWIGEKMTQGLDGAAYIGKLYSAPTIMYLKSKGIDTTQYEALVDANSRAAAISLMFALGGRRAGGKAETLTAADMSNALNEVGRSGQEAAVIKAESNRSISAQEALALRQRSEPQKRLQYKSPVPDQMGAPKLLEDRTGRPITPDVIEGEYLPPGRVGGRQDSTLQTSRPSNVSWGEATQNPYMPKLSELGLDAGDRLVPYAPSKSSGQLRPLDVSTGETYTPLTLEQFTAVTARDVAGARLSPSKRPGRQRAISKQELVEYDNYRAGLDEVNIRIAQRTREMQDLGQIELAKFAEEEVAMSLFQNNADVAALMGEGMSGPAARQMAAGHARIRATNMISEEAVFARALSKLVKSKVFLGTLARLPMGQRDTLMALVGRLQRPAAYGDKLEMLQRKLEVFEPRQTLYPPERVGTMQKAEVQIDSTPRDTFTFRDKLTFLREMLLAQEAARLPGKGYVVRYEGMPPAGELAMKKWGQPGEEGVVSPRGVWYTPEEMQMFSILTKTLMNDGVPLTTQGLRNLADEAMSLTRFKEEMGPLLGKGPKTLSAAGFKRKSVKKSNPKRTAYAYQNMKVAFDNTLALIEGLQTIRLRRNRGTVAAAGRRRRESFDRQISKKGSYTVGTPQAAGHTPAPSAEAVAQSQAPKGFWWDRGGAFPKEGEVTRTPGPRATRGKTPKQLNYKGKFGKQRGAVDMGDSSILEMADYLIRRWKERDTSAPSQKEGKIVRQETPKFTYAVELFGGKMLGDLMRRSGDHIAAGKYELPRLIAMLDQLPKAYWAAGIGQIKSWYQIRLNLTGDLISSTTNGWSLYSIFNKHGAKFMTGFRRYAPNKVPGALTLQRLKPGLERDVFMDLTSGQEAKTPLGKDLRAYADRLYRLAEQSGLDPATYLKNYYPIMLRQLNKADRQKFYEAAAAKGIPAKQVDHVIEVALDNGGLVVPRKKYKGGGGEQKNLMEARTFFQKWTMEELRPFIVQDVGMVFDKYAKGTVKMLTDAQRWGKNDELWKNQFNLALREAQEMGKPLGEYQINTLNKAREIIDHTYSEAPRWVVEGMRKGIAWENILKLGMVVPGSLAELAIGLMNPTFQLHYAKALATEMPATIVRGTARAIWRGVEKTEAGQWGERIARSVDSELNDALTATNAADLQSTGSNIAFQLNGLTQYTNMTVNINVDAFTSALKASAVKEFNLRLGRTKRKPGHDANMKMFEYYGLPAEGMLKWYRDGTKMDGSYYSNEVAFALIKYLNDTVMAPRGVNMPRWQSSPLLAPLRHLNTYVTVFGNTVLPNLFYGLKGDLIAGAPNNLMLRGTRGAQALGGLAAILSLGVLSEELMDIWKYGGSDKTPLRGKVKDDNTYYAYQLAKYINRSGINAFAGGKVYDVLASTAYGRIDSGDILETAAGTVYTDMAKAAIVLGGVASGDTTADTAAREIIDLLVPFQTALPRGPSAPAAKLVSREQMREGLAAWIESNTWLERSKRRKRR